MDRAVLRRLQSPGDQPGVRGARRHVVDARVDEGQPGQDQQQESSPAIVSPVFISPRPLVEWWRARRFPGSCHGRRSPGQRRSRVPGRRLDPEGHRPGGEGGDLAIVLSGGGARAAYQVGVLRGLARHLPHLRFPIVTGVSAGAINAAFFAAHPGSLFEAASALCDLWAGLQVENIFRVDTPSLARYFTRWASRLVSGGTAMAPDVHGLVDTRPLHATLRERPRHRGRRDHRHRAQPGAGNLKAMALTALNYSTGQTVTWVQGLDFQPWTQPERRSVHARISVDHIMASAALPLFFPADTPGRLLVRRRRRAPLGAARPRPPPGGDAHPRDLAPLRARAPRRPSGPRPPATRRRPRSSAT